METESMTVNWPGRENMSTIRVPVGLKDNVNALVKELSGLTHSNITRSDFVLIAVFKLYLELKNAGDDYEKICAILDTSEEMNIK